jgi:O-acetyl-ADP-ribose deacetylase (regulator of RNase III)
MTTLSVVRDDITTLAVGAIVNAANSSLMGGGGVDGAIHRAGGPAILADCQAIVAEWGRCAPGDAVVTGAGELPAAIVIHTVGPIWTADGDSEALDATLASCYRTSLELAHQHRVREVAFPNISTGVYGFPKDRAARVAVNATLDWIEQHPDSGIEEILFVCFDDENHALYAALLA